VEDTCTLRELRGAIETQLSVPEADQTLSLRQELLLSKGDLSAFDDLKPGRKNDGKKLKALGVEHGAMVYLRYSVARDPTPTMAAQHRSELRGGKMTVETMIAAQTRIELQTAARCASVSLDARCANRFQSYVNNTLGFEQMRFGWMYGTEKAVAASDDEGEKEASNAPAIEVHAIYEPEQEGAADRFDLAAKNGEEDARADALASSLGLKKVGMVFNVSTSAARDYTLSAFEVRTMAECQARYGPAFVTAVVMMLEDEDEDGEVTKSVSFEPFQVSEQCVALFKDGWFAEDAAEDAGLTKLNKEVIVVDKVSKDVTEVDNDRFLVPVKILDHAGPLATTFPVENRLHPIQTAEDLRDALRRSAVPYAERLRDFHLLLFLSKHLDAADMRMVATQANKPGGEIQEGHKIIIDSIAGM
jgi:nuclear protein localization family protein 4